MGAASNLSFSACCCVCDTQETSPAFFNLATTVGVAGVIKAAKTLVRKQWKPISSSTHPKNDADAKRTVEALYSTRESATLLQHPNGCRNSPATHVVLPLVAKGVKFSSTLISQACTIGVEKLYAKPSFLPEVPTCHDEEVVHSTHGAGVQEVNVLAAM